MTTFSESPGLNEYNNNTGFSNVSPDFNCLSLSGNKYNTRIVTLADLDQRTLSAWAELESQALEANAYLSPYFILPAIKHLEPTAKILIVLVEKNHAGGTLLTGIGVFRAHSASRKYPLRHLQAYASCHSFLSGVLVSRHYAADTIRTLLMFIRQQGWHGVEFKGRVGEGSQASLISDIAAELGAGWIEYERKSRAMLIPSEGGETYLSRLPAGRRNDLRRCWRRLGEHGRVHWKQFSGIEVTKQSIERFIELEDLGWKGHQGTSLKSEPRQLQFFREMITAFDKAGRALLTEIHLNDKIIASSINLVSGTAGFAFKLGWDPAYAKMSPGILNVAEWTRQLPVLRPELEYIDSGSPEGSFMDALWSHRRDLVSGMYTTSHLGKYVMRIMQKVRHLKT